MNKTKSKYNKTCGSLMQSRLKAGLSRNEVCRLTSAVYDRVVRVEQRVRENETAGQPKLFGFTQNNIVAMGKIREAIDIKGGRGRGVHLKDSTPKAKPTEPQPAGVSAALLRNYLNGTPEGTVITVDIPGRNGTYLKFVVK